MQNIFANGIELTDAELAALPIDIMAVWLDMWYESRDQEAYALRQAEEGYDPINYAELLSEYEDLLMDQEYAAATRR